MGVYITRTCYHDGLPNEPNIVDPNPFSINPGSGPDIAALNHRLWSGGVSSASMRWFYSMCT